VHSCRSGIPIEGLQWVVFTRTVFAYISHYETSTFGQKRSYINDQGREAMQQLLPFTPSNRYSHFRTYADDRRRDTMQQERTIDPPKSNFADAEFSRKLSS